MNTVMVASSGFSVADILSQCVTLVNSAWDVIAANPVLSLCVGACLIGVGFSIFRRAKSAAIS